MSRTIRRNRHTAQKAPTIPEPWEVAKAGNARVAIMPSRTHGVESNRTRRRKERQAARVGGWDS